MQKERNIDYKGLIFMAIAMIFIAFGHWLFVLIFFTIALFIAIIIKIDFFIIAATQFILLIVATTILCIYIYKKYLPGRYKNKSLVKKPQ